jgi:hypothetical protein
MNKIAYAFLLLATMVSCNNDAVPKDVLEEQKMEKVLWDVLRADEMVAYQFELDSTIDRKNKSIQLYQQIFMVHKISPEEFKRSFKFYQTHPSKLKIVLDSLRSTSNKVHPGMPVNAF